MKKKIFKSSILLSIFKRKGGEGCYTKIITTCNNTFFINQLKSLEEDEEALICFKQDELNWVLITNTRILQSCSNIKQFIEYTKIHKVYPALKDEFVDGIFNKHDFTYLTLEDSNNEYRIKVEKGEPFQGIYQMLNFIALSNR